MRVPSGSARTEPHPRSELRHCSCRAGVAIRCVGRTPGHRPALRHAANHRGGGSRSRAREWGGRPGPLRAADSRSGPRWPRHHSLSCAVGHRNGAPRTRTPDAPRSWVAACGPARCSRKKTGAKARGRPAETASPGGSAAHHPGTRGGAAEARRPGAPLARPKASASRREAG
ncbi:PREDICTED: translation initiation factor IF-2-like [Chinchilla lanigera]|uniref:translation initiation factor IF-2-like n=1 Tax=Chinchilla lanigera TaxID=34839 RepID=UPI000696DC3F|nr:PREDICTED: translation initiation factor IF-2-like [Chinchilla lanigera]